MADNPSFDTIPANTSTLVSVQGAGGSNTGFVNSPGDHDWFRVNLTAQQPYIFDVHGTGLSDPTLTLRDSSGAQVAFDDDGGPGFDSRIVLPFASRTGVFFLDVGGFGGNTGSYSVSSRVDDVPDDVNSTRNINPSGPNNVQEGVINSAIDEDFFQVFLTAGLHYDFGVFGSATGTIPALSDPTLGIRNSSGTLLAFNDDQVPGANLTSSIRDFTPTTSGSFYLDVGGYSAVTGNYLVTAAFH